MRSKRFRVVLKQRTRNESQRPRENWASKRAGRGWEGGGGETEGIKETENKLILGTAMR